MQHNYRKELEQLLENLAQERDELQLQFHLAKVEAREEWETTEKKWHKFKQKGERAMVELDHASGEVKESLLILADEIKKGYQRIRQQLR